MNTDAVIKNILYYGSISPSSHNTQPWSFKVTPNAIELLVDSQRTLKHSDPHGWETYLSMGACLTNLEEATKAYGLLKEIHLFPDPNNDKLVAKLLLNSASKNIDEKQLKIIKRRQTNRSNYQPRQVPDKFVREWEKIVKSNDLSAIFVSIPEKIVRISDLQTKATQLAFSDTKFRYELSQWIRNNLTRAHDGMPGYVTNIPLPMSLIGPWLIKNVNIGKMQGSIEKKWILSSPLILILTIDQDKKEKLVKAGQVFEKIALDVTSKGLVYAPLGAIIEVPEAAKELKSLLEIDETPVMLVRIGYSSKKYRYAPKREVEEIIN